MKKVLSLLFVALLAMSAWADTVVTVDFSQQNFGDQQQIHELNIDGVILGFDKGTNSNNPPKYFDTGASIRLYGGNTMKVVAEQNIKKIDFTFGSGDGDNNILCDVGNYNKAGKQWTIGSSDPSKQVMFTIEGSSGHRRVHQLVITIEDANPVTDLVPPVFHPEDGTTFTNSLEVSITCPTQLTVRLTGQPIITTPPRSTSTRPRPSLPLPRRAVSIPMQPMRPIPRLSRPSRLPCSRLQPAVSMTASR